MPEIKINIDAEEYTLQCEPGEENELKKAVDVVNEKIEEYVEQKHKILKIQNLLEKLEKMVNAN